jgi:cell division protein FtsB/cell division protein DivIC
LVQDQGFWFENLVYSRYGIRKVLKKLSKKPFLLLVLLLFLILGFFTFSGDKGILHLLRLQKELARIKETNVKIEEENRRLREEVSRLQHDKRYIEEIARKELGMVKEGEVIYQFDTPKAEKEKPK